MAGNAQRRADPLETRGGGGACRKLFAGPELPLRGGAEGWPRGPRTGVGARSMRSLIDLSRLPSQGQAVGIELRKTAGLAGVAAGFRGRAEAKVERVFRPAADAAFLSWASCRALSRPRSAALRQGRRPRTPWPAIRDAAREEAGDQGCVGGGVLGAPEGFAAKLAPLARDGRACRKQPARRSRVFFVDSLARLKRRSRMRLARRRGGRRAVDRLAEEGLRRSKTDLSETVVREFGLAAGMG